MYSERDIANSTFWQFYMVFGLGCIIFFFIGVCALLCCCRHRVRHERKGYIIRDADQTAPLIIPSASPGSILVAPVTVPGPSSPYPNAPYPNAPYPNEAYPNAPYPNAPYPGCPPAAPPQYESPPKY